MSDKFSNEDIFDNDLFAGKILENAKALDNQLKNIEEGFSSLQGTIKKTLSSIEAETSENIKKLDELFNSSKLASTELEKVQKRRAENEKLRLKTIQTIEKADKEAARAAEKRAKDKEKREKDRQKQIEANVKLLKKQKQDEEKAAIAAQKATEKAAKAEKDRADKIQEATKDFKRFKETQDATEFTIEELTKATAAARKEVNKLVTAQGEQSKEAKEALKDFSKLNSTLTETRKRLRETTQSETDLKKVTGQLENTYEGWGAAIRQAEKQLKRLDASVPENEAKIKRLTRTINDNRDKQKAFNENIGNFRDNVGNYGSALDAIKDQFGGIATAAGPAGIAVAAITAAIAGFTASLDIVRQVNSELNQTRILTGLGAEESEKLRDQVSATAATFGKEYNEVLISANNLANQYKISQTEALRLINEGFVNGADATGDFLDKIKEYGVQFRESGFTAQEFIKVATQEVKGGVFNDKLLDSVKELGLSLRELTQTQKDAIEGAFGTEFAQRFEGQVKSGSLTAKQALGVITEEADKVNLSVSQVQTLTADLFKGAGEDAGGFAEVLLQLNEALNGQTEELVEYQKAQNEILKANKEFSEAQREFAESTGINEQSFDEFIIKLKTGGVRALQGFIELWQVQIDLFVDAAKFIDDSLTNSIEALENAFDSFNDFVEDSVSQIGQFTGIVEESSFKSDQFTSAIANASARLTDQRTILERVKDGLEGLNPVLERASNLFDELAKNEIVENAKEQLKELFDLGSEFFDASLVQEAVKQTANVTKEGVAVSIGEIKRLIDNIQNLRDNLEENSKGRDFEIKQIETLDDLLSQLAIKENALKVSSSKAEKEKTKALTDRINLRKEELSLIEKELQTQKTALSEAETDKILQIERNKSAQLIALREKEAEADKLSNPTAEELQARADARVEIESEASKEISRIRLETLNEELKAIQDNKDNIVTAEILATEEIKNSLDKKVEDVKESERERLKTLEDSGKLTSKAINDSAKLISKTEEEARLKKEQAEEDLQNRIFKLNEEEAKKELEIEKAKNEELKKLDKEEFDRKKEQQQKDLKLLQEQADQIKQLGELAVSIFNEIGERRSQALQAEADQIEKNIDRISEAAKNGTKEAEESLIKEEALLAENEKKQRRTRRLQALQEVLITGFATFAANKKTEPEGALSKTLFELGALSAALTSIAIPTAYTGVVDTGGPGTVDKNGGMPWILHPNERVTSKEKNEQLRDVGGRRLEDSELVSIVQEHNNKKLLGESVTDFDNYTQLSVVKTFDDSGIKEKLSQVIEVQKSLPSKMPVYSINYNAIADMVIERVKQGERIKEKHTPNKRSWRQ